MKKKILSFVILSLFTIFCTACGNSIEKTLEKIEKAKSYTMVISLPTDMGSMETTYKIDGDKEYIKLDMGIIESEFYISKENGKYYQYSKFFNSWTKQEVDAPAEIEFDPLELEAKWFKQEGNKYVLKEEYYAELFGEEELELLDSFAIEDKNDMIIFTATFSDENESYTMTITISNINNTTVTLPQVN